MLPNPALHNIFEEIDSNFGKAIEHELSCEFSINGIRIKQ